jgi:prepilin-type N-terminal cleavage/methylation domain-containing protein
MRGEDFPMKRPVRGFTLIELLVVIAIIAVLIAPPPVGARIWAKCEIRLIFFSSPAVHGWERKTIVKSPLQGGLAGRIPPWPRGSNQPRRERLG